jgi:hypothetical protein
MTENDLLNRITVNPRIFGGKPIIREQCGTLPIFLSDVKAQRGRWPRVTSDQLAVCSIDLGLLIPRSIDPSLCRLQVGGDRRVAGGTE